MRRSHRDLLLVISGSQTGCPCLDQADFKCTDNGCGDGDDAAKELFREKGYFPPTRSKKIQRDHITPSEAFLRNCYNILSI